MAVQENSNESLLYLTEQTLFWTRLEPCLWTPSPERSMEGR